ncbi:hypothetical protein DFH06DRAFT_1138605 [Mycena polygramma]|nr:hypothetical protein DFH06DRAFT_1138605 [Mycena polygramma]
MFILRYGRLVRMDCNGKTLLGDVTESPVSVTVYAAKYPDPVFPLELLTRILSFTMEHDTVYDPCLLIRTRESVRLVHSQFKSYVDARPEFWSHIVVTIDDDPLVLSRVLESTGTSEFSLTIRMVDFSTLVAGFADGWFDRVDETVAPLMELLDAHMERCYALNDFTVSFGSYHFSHFRPPDLMDFSFNKSPLLPDITDPFTKLSFVRHSVPDPVFTYTSGQCSWPNLARIMDATPTLCVMGIDGISMTVTPSAFMIPVAFNFLHTLEVNFRGDRSTACLVAHLNAPQLRTLKIMVQDRMDMVCLAICTGLLWDIKELVIQGACEDITGVDQVFHLMHRLVSLDLSAAGPSFLRAFHVASLQPPRSHGPNWNACPALRHLLVSNTHVGVVVDLLEARMGMSYARLDTVHLGLMADGDDVGALDWFNERSISRGLWPDSGFCPGAKELDRDFLASKLPRGFRLSDAAIFLDSSSIAWVLTHSSLSADANGFASNLQTDVGREILLVQNNKRQVYIVCRGLDHVVRTQSVFRDGYDAFSCQSIAAWEAFSGTECVIDLRLGLFRVDSELPRSQECGTVIEESLQFASTILHRCRKLSILLDDQASTSAIIHHLSSVVAPNLEVLTVQHPAVSPFTRELIILLHNRTFLGADLPRLAILRLSGLALDWSEKAYFDTLTALVLQDFEELDGPMLLCVLKASTRLRYASIRKVHCRWAGEVTRVELPGLRELDVALNGNTGVPTLLGFLDVMLEALYVTAETPTGLRLLTKKCPKIVAYAQKIAIRGDADVASIRSVLYFATLAQTLDFSHGGRGFIHALINSSYPASVVSLSVSASNLRLVWNMLEARAAHNPSSSSQIFQDLVVCDVVRDNGNPVALALDSEVWARIALSVADFRVVYAGMEKASFNARWIVEDDCIKYES